MRGVNEKKLLPPKVLSVKDYIILSQGGKTVSTNKTLQATKDIILTKTQKRPCLHET